MANKKVVHWSRKKLFATGAQYLLAFGQNSAGKSYQAKEECVERALKGRRFFFIKRWDSHIKQSDMNSYFDDYPVAKATKGEWDGITAWQGKFYFYKYEDGHRIKSDEIGSYGALNMWQAYKSNVYVNYDLILYEEFISKDIYLDNEPDVLQKFATIIFRKRKGTVLMLGNAINRSCPYFYEWCPHALEMKMGTIDLYHMKDETSDEVIDIAVEWTDHVEGTGSMFFGKASKTINGGEWDIDIVPKLPKPLDEYENVYQMLLKYQNFAMVLNLLIDPWEGTKLLYVYPYTGSKKYDRVITDEFSDKLLTSNAFRDIPAERFIVDCIDGKRVCYSDNLTGSDFIAAVAGLDI